MREYRAHFSFYSEEYGYFDDCAYRVQAESPFDTRIKAWEAFDQDEESKFRSCAKLYAVTWNPNPLDAGDYFYSHAADIKQAVGHIDNVDMPNDKLEKHGKHEYYERQKHYYLGALQTIDGVAKDLYAEKGIVPPSIYEELHYAEELYYALEYGEQSDAMWKKIKSAKEWDSNSCAQWDIRDLFKNGYITLCNEIVRFRDQFGRNSIYPVHADIEDSEYTYISRWERLASVKTLDRLPALTQADTIPHSADHMTYDYQILLMNLSQFSASFNKPVNMIWTPGEEAINLTNDTTDKFLVDNVITGEHILAQRSDFLGVLRPDTVARFDFEELKAEYAATHENPNETAGQLLGEYTDEFSSEDEQEGLDEP